MKLQGVIFDLDGTLVDSEPVWALSDAKFVEHFGGTFDQAWSDQAIGMGARAFVAMVKQRFGLAHPDAELEALKEKLYLETSRDRLVAFPEMVKLVKGFAAQGMPMAVASGSSPKVIETVLEQTGLRPYFRWLVSSDSVARPKPAPDVFLATARQMELKPHDVLVFEDSRYGVEAAKAAGMKVCAIPTVWPEGAQLALRRADLLFEKGFAEFKAESVLEWIDVTFCQCADCTLYELGRCQD